MKIKGSDILVTGGAGFIGSHVASRLEELGARVHVADRMSYAGKLKAVGSMVSDALLWYGDLKDEDFCMRLAGYPFNAVVHLAASTHVDRSLRDPHIFVGDNVLGTTRLLEAFATVREEHCPRMIIYSTDEVFGPTPDGMAFTEDTPMKPSNPYSACKAGVEAMCHAYRTAHGLPLTVVRPCNTYGPLQHPEKAIPRFTNQALSGRLLTIHGDGTGSRDWLHVSDHADAIATLLTAEAVDTSYNIAASDERSDLEVAEAVCDTLRVPFRYTFIEKRPGHDRRYWMDGGRLRLLGWQPKTEFRDGLRQTIEWFAAHQAWWQDDYVRARKPVRVP